MMTQAPQTNPKPSHTMKMVNLITTEAEERAKSFKGEGNSAYQIRRFYNELKRLQRKVQLEAFQTEQADRNLLFERVLPRIKMCIPKAKYALARGVAKEKFVEWLVAELGKVNSWESFEKFMTYFEAVVCYYGEDKDKKKSGSKGQAQGSRR